MAKLVQSATAGPTVDLGPDATPGAIQFGEGAVWAVTYSFTGPDAHPVLHRIDQSTAEVAATIPLHATPSWENAADGITVGHGSVWIVGGGVLPGQGWGGIVQRIDPLTNRVVATIPLEGSDGAGDVAVSEDAVWVSFSGPSRTMYVARIDALTTRVVATVALEGDSVREVMYASGYVLVRSRRGATDDMVSVIDAATNRVIAVRPLGPATGPFVAVDGQIWAGPGWTLVTLDPSTGEITRRMARLERAVSSSSLAAGVGGLWFIGYDPAGKKEPIIERYNLQTGKLDISVDPPREATALTIGPDSLWLLNLDGSVTRVRLE